MITTDAALYGAGGATAVLDEVLPVRSTCGCGQDLGGVHRQHCPRCGCCLA
ncbi:hypothetical protein [Nocardioides aequoreus]|uniref:hypothetical protein n=1 Tax=Nocardioides aequoreus TaxID=397278 RepID=UPI000A534824|nr:hypothetical protein [Nocardioides aequoreus]